MANVDRQTFNPDNVMMHEQLDGTLLNDFNAPILSDVLESSKVFQLGVVQEMNGKSEKQFSYWADKPGAYWVGEGQKIQTTKATALTATMRSYKIGAIIVASREYLNYTYSQFFTALRPQLAEAIQKKIDEAVILGVDNPFAKSVDSVIDGDRTVTGDITVDNVLAVQDVLLEHDVEPNAFVSKAQNQTALRGLRDEHNNSYYDRASNTIDGIQAVNLKSSEFEKGTLYAGDFNHLFYGIPYNMSYKISEEGQLSTITNEDGSPVNLFEQELIALRVTMDVATHIAKDEAFSKLVPTP